MINFFSKVISISYKKLIVIDARLWHEGRTGIGRVTEMFFQDESDDCGVIILGSIIIKDKYPHSNILETEVTSFGISFLLQNIILNFLAIRNTQCTIVYPHYFGTGCYLKKILVVHDLMAITHYKFFFKRFNFLKKSILSLCVANALKNSFVICPSKYSQEVLYSLFKKRSIFIPNGTLLNQEAACSSMTVQTSKDRHLNVKLVGYVGNTRPHKNIEGIKKFCKINNFELILFSDYKSSLDRTDSLLVEFYKYCDAIIMLSYCEGFGIPLIEGALFGKCLFASRIPAFEELSHLNINYVDEDSIVVNPILSNSNYVEENYRFNQLKKFNKYFFSQGYI